MPSGDDFGHQIKCWANYGVSQRRCDGLATATSPPSQEDLWMSVEVRLPSQRIDQTAQQALMCQLSLSHNPLATRRGGDRADSGTRNCLNPGLLSGFGLQPFDPQGDLAGPEYALIRMARHLAKRSYITYRPASIPPGAAGAGLLLRHMCGMHPQTDTSPENSIPGRVARISTCRQASHAVARWRNIPCG